MQRIPSVALSRGDGGEGRNISVRGLGAGFTRVRINGMEGAAQAGASDIYGAGNSGRSFDFNVFPTEIFSQLAVRKTTSADVEEGSLGATVDLRAPRPFDYTDDTIFNVTGRGIMNSVSEDVDPRASALFSKNFADGTFGILISGAYQERTSARSRIFSGGHPLGQCQRKQHRNGCRSDPAAVLHADRLDHHRPEPRPWHARRDCRQLQRRQPMA